MNPFAINLLLALAWAALAGEFTLVTLGIGFLLGFAALWLARPLFGDTHYFVRLPRLLRLGAVFVVELVVSSLRVARDVLTPVPKNKPGIVAVPLRVTGETGTLLLSSLVTLTPGTLSLDLSENGQTLYVHAMFVDDPGALRAEIAETLEQPVLEALE